MENDIKIVTAFLLTYRMLVIQFIMKIMEGCVVRRLSTFHQTTKLLTTDVHQLWLLAGDSPQPERCQVSTVGTVLFF